VKHQVVAEWQDGIDFIATQQSQQIQLASPESVRAQPGVSPKQLLLTALAGCTGMDVASLLTKMRVPYTSLAIRVSGELTEEHPKVYSHIHVVYEVGTTQEYAEKVERSVELSVTRYCGVSAMLAKAANITHEIVYQS